MQPYVGGKVLPMPLPILVDGVLGGMASARVRVVHDEIERARAIVRGDPILTVTSTELQQALEESIDSVERRLSDAGPLTSNAATQVRGLLEECLTVAGGILLRVKGTEADAFAIADQLIREISSAARRSWIALTVPGEEERTSYSTGVITLRFPGPDIWMLPIAAHELGHVVARDLEVTPTDGGPKYNPLTETFYSGRSIPRQREELWCDFFATYVLGPAYPWALLADLPSADRPPNEEFEDPVTSLATHPSTQIRLYATLKTLECMNAATGPYDAPYALAIDRLTSICNPQVSVNSGKVIRLLIGQFWNVVTGYLGMCRFSVPMSARWLSEQLASGQPISADPRLRVLDVVAAAWNARVDSWIRGADTTEHLEGRALDVCRRLVPSPATTERQEKPGGIHV